MIRRLIVMMFVTIALSCKVRHSRLASDTTQVDKPWISQKINDVNSLKSDLSPLSQGGWLTGYFYTLKETIYKPGEVDSGDKMARRQALIAEREAIITATAVRVTTLMEEIADRFDPAVIEAAAQQGTAVGNSRISQQKARARALMQMFQSNGTFMRGFRELTNSFLQAPPTTFTSFVDLFQNLNFEKVNQQQTNLIPQSFIDAYRSAGTLQAEIVTEFEKWLATEAGGGGSVQPGNPSGGGTVTPPTPPAPPAIPVDGGELCSLDGMDQTCRWFPSAAWVDANFDKGISSVPCAKGECSALYGRLRELLNAQLMKCSGPACQVPEVRQSYEQALAKMRRVTPALRIEVVSAASNENAPLTYDANQNLLRVPLSLLNPGGTSSEMAHRIRVSIGAESDYAPNSNFLAEPSWYELEYNAADARFNTPKLPIFSMHLPGRDDPTTKQWTPVPLQEDYLVDQVKFQINNSWYRQWVFPFVVNDKLTADPSAPTPSDRIELIDSTFIWNGEQNWKWSIPGNIQRTPQTIPGLFNKVFGTIVEPTGPKEYTFRLPKAMEVRSVTVRQLQSTGRQKILLRQLPFGKMTLQPSQARPGVPFAATWNVTTNSDHPGFRACKLFRVDSGRETLLGEGLSGSVNMSLEQSTGLVLRCTSAKTNKEYVQGQLIRVDLQ